MFYDDLAPGVFTYRYYQISDHGASATVGIQAFRTEIPFLIVASSGFLFFVLFIFLFSISQTDVDIAVHNTAITYSCNQAVIEPGLEVVLNSIIGTVQHRNFSLAG